jgi:hypothetical protein
LVTQKFADENLTPELKEEFKKEALERLNTFIIECTLDEFSDEDLETFNKMVEDKKTPEELNTFTQAHIEDYPEFMTEVLQEFQEMYLE